MIVGHPLRQRHFTLHSHPWYRSHRYVSSMAGRAVWRFVAVRADCDTQW